MSHCRTLPLHDMFANVPYIAMVNIFCSLDMFIPFDLTIIIHSFSIIHRLCFLRHSFGNWISFHHQVKRPLTPI